MEFKTQETSKIVLVKLGFTPCIAVLCGYIWVALGESYHRWIATSEGLLDNGKSLMLALAQMLLSIGSEAREHVRRFHELSLHLVSKKHWEHMALTCWCFDYWAFLAAEKDITIGSFQEMSNSDLKGGVVCDLKPSYAVKTYSKQFIIRSRQKESCHFLLPSESCSFR
jgi:hypothetical protein